ncbi:MAG: hypothetical protein R3C97_04415 [Geminicoccaceae bacterium]
MPEKKDRKLAFLGISSVFPASVGELDLSIQSTLKSHDASEREFSMNVCMYRYKAAIVLIFLTGCVPRIDPFLETDPLEWRASDWSFCPDEEPVAKGQVVYVLEEVARPGEYAWCPGMRVGDAILAAGGFRPVRYGKTYARYVAVQPQIQSESTAAVPFGQPLQAGSLVTAISPCFF